MADGSLADDLRLLDREADEVQHLSRSA